MLEAVGVGLAQRRSVCSAELFVFSPGDDEVLAIVNPKITTSRRRDRGRRRGLSLAPGRHRARSSAPSRSRLEGKDERGATSHYDLEGIPARTVQHELDHLDGVLIVDRTTPEARREALAMLRPRVVLR